MTDPLLAAGRGLLLVGALLLGGAAVSTWLAPARAIARPVRLAGVLLLAGLLVQGVGQLRAFDAFAPDAGPIGETLAMIAATGWARNRALVTLLACGALVVAGRRRALADGGTRGLALALLLLWPRLGHAAAVDDGAIRAYALAFAHLAGATAWLGTLLLLARPWWSQVSLLVAEIPRYGRMALVAAPLTVLTGGITAWPRVGGLAGLTTTAYGGLLLAKLAAVALVLALGAVHHRRLVRAVEAPTRGTLLAEGVGALVVLALTGWLAESAPA